MESKRKSTIPVWSETMLQGLAYWMGYKRTLYRHHLLTEGAIVAEAVSLIHSNLKDSERVECEVGYPKLGSQAGKTLADIVVFSGDQPTCVIEVKRGKASNSLIAADLQKLQAIKKINKSVRCFLLVASQGNLPTNYVDKQTGEAKKGTYQLDGIGFRIIRVCKAASSFKSLKSAHYACLLELKG